MAADNIEVAVKAYTEEVDKGFQKAGKAVDKFGNKLGSNINKVKKFSYFFFQVFHFPHPFKLHFPNNPIL